MKTPATQVGYYTKLDVPWPPMAHGHRCTPVRPCRLPEHVQNGPMGYAYKVEARRSARHDAIDRGVCQGMREHAPMLTALQIRRLASLLRLPTSASTGPVSSKKVGRSSRRRQRPSRMFIMIIVRPPGHLGFAPRLDSGIFCHRSVEWL